jgi:hypothetical protein
METRPTLDFLRKNLLIFIFTILYSVIMNELLNTISPQGLNSLDDEGHHLGNFSYDINGSPLQYFTIQVTY